MRLSPVTDASLIKSDIFRAYCFNIDVVGDCVYIMGPKVGERYQVTRVDNTTPSKMPAVGLIIEKTSPTECVVQTAGLLKNAFGAFTPNTRLFVGDTGRPKQTYTRPTTGLKLIQIIGLAISSTDIIIAPESPVIIYPPL